MKKTAIIFGGSGYIGSTMLSFFIEQNVFSKYWVCDINKLDGFEKNANVTYKNIDVRKSINLEVEEIDLASSWIFNFAAVHREPGHDRKEYFDTNVPGAENINNFARTTGIKNIFFTSSIAPYGKSSDVRTEDSPIYPDTPYGISKALAEKIHQEWLAEDISRRLIIVRPGVIFGPEDPGNVYRMVKAIKRGTFVLPNGGNIIKAYGYVYGLLESILFTMNKSERFIIYNYTENPLVYLKDMVNIIKQECNYEKPIFRLSIKTLILIAHIIQFFSKLIGRKTEIHPNRVEKAGLSTHIHPKYLVDNDFDFKYDFENALKHWKYVSPEDFK